jgi:hypothetical protein
VFSRFNRTKMAFARDRIPPYPPYDRNKKINAYPKIFGEMSELAEGARLEIVCAVKSGTEGSNPSLSATDIIISSTYKAK